MIDFEGLKTKIQILDLVDGVKRVASSGGGEYAGPCPFCGGTDRFRVQPDKNIWLCRHCTNGVWRDVVDFIARRDNVTIGAAAQTIAGGFPGFSKQTEKPKKPEYHAYKSPPGEWQATAREIVADCEKRLFTAEGARALEYLHKRGLADSTIKAFRLGFSTGYNHGGLYVPHGITIPAFANGVLWYVKIRTNTNPKYKLIAGSKPAAIFNADELAKDRICLIVEGEFNAMIGHQTVNDILPVASMGSAGNRPELATWGPYFINKSLILALYDDDHAGHDGAMALYQQLGERVKLTALPANVGDLNDFYIGGGNVWEWLKPQLQFWEPEIPGIGETIALAAEG
jgi:DNA primase